MLPFYSNVTHLTRFRGHYLLHFHPMVSISQDVNAYVNARLNLRPDIKIPSFSSIGELHKSKRLGYGTNNVINY